MLTIWGKILKDSKTLQSETYTSDNDNLSEALLECVEFFAKKFDMEAPMWHTNHTKQFGIFHKAVFKKDDFIDKIDFDRFEMQILENK